MIWGYAGLVVIAFLLTAVATWTGQPPTRGKALAGLTAFWLLARICMFIPGWGVTASGIFGTIFFWYGAVCMALPVIRSQNKRNYVAVFAIFVLGGTHFAFHLKVQPFDAIALMTGLQSGLIMVAGFIGLIGYADYLVLYVQTSECAANPQSSMGGARFTLAAYADRHADGA